MGLDYKALAEAGTEKIKIGKRPVISYPGNETVEWYGFKRHNFELEGYKGFIVEPPNPAPGLPWSWCIQWAESFVPRTPALKLLERGFHHVFLDVHETKLNPAGIRVLEKFYAMLRGLGFHKKMALIGMSYGGLYSFRWAAEHPETVGAIFADAPVTDLGFGYGRDLTDTTPELLPHWASEAQKVADAYGVKPEELSAHPLSPNNNYKAIADAQIPILVIRSGQDQSVNPCKNIDVFEKNLKAAGGDITVIRRDYYGHHPHGLDDPQPLVDFILQHYPAFEEE